MVLPKFFIKLLDDSSIDARRPVVEQLAEFADLGWPQPPSAGELQQRMVEYVTNKFDWDRQNYPYPGKTYAYSKKEYFSKAEDTAGGGGGGGDFHFDSFRDEVVEPDVKVDEVEDAFSGDEDAFSCDEGKEGGAYM